MIGTDLVHVPVFGEQLRAPGTRFAQQVFAPSELLVARRRGLEDAAYERHLAGRWAAKEALVKAWSQAIFGMQPPLDRDSLDWREIEVVPDAWGRISLRVTGRAGAAFAAQFGDEPVTSASISHDGDYAIAVVQL